MEVPWCAFHLHTKDRGIMVGLIRRELFPESAYSKGQIVGHGRGRAQLLYGIPGLGDGPGGLIDSAIESLFGWTLREEVGNRLKPEQQSMKTLKQSVVQFARDARALRQPFFKPDIHLRSQSEHSQAK